MSPSKFDRQEFINRVCTAARARKVYDVSLRPDGVSIGQIMATLGPRYAFDALPDGKYRIAKKQPSPA